jgi:hypothetical protein
VLFFYRDRLLAARRRREAVRKLNSVAPAVQIPWDSATPAAPCKSSPFPLPCRPISGKRARFFPLHPESRQFSFRTCRRRRLQPGGDLSRDIHAVPQQVPARIARNTLVNPPGVAIQKLKLIVRCRLKQHPRIFRGFRVHRRRRFFHHYEILRVRLAAFDLLQSLQLLGQLLHAPLAGFPLRPQHGHFIRRSSDPQNDIRGTQSARARRFLISDR